MNLRKILIISKSLIKKNLLLISFSIIKLIKGIKRKIPKASKKAPNIIKNIK